MQKPYLSIIYISYIFLYFFFCSLLTTLLLEKVLSRVASKNKQTSRPTQLRQEAGRISWISIFTLHAGVLNTLPTSFYAFACRVTKTLR